MDALVPRAPNWKKTPNQTKPNNTQPKPLPFWGPWSVRHLLLFAFRWPHTSLYHPYPQWEPETITGGRENEMITIYFGVRTFAFVLVVLYHDFSTAHTSYWKLQNSMKTLDASDKQTRKDSVKQKHAQRKNARHGAGCKVGLPPSSARSSSSRKSSSAPANKRRVR